MGDLESVLPVIDLSFVFLFILLVSLNKIRCIIVHKKHFKYRLESSFVCQQSLIEVHISAVCSLCLSFSFILA